MIELPSKIKAKFLELKRESKKYVEIKRIENYYFVYKATSRWDKETKKVVKISKYLGRITDEGKFIVSKPRVPKTSVVTVSPNLSENLEIKQQSPEVQTFDFSKVSKYEETLLRALSMNARISTSVLSKMLGIKETATTAQIKKIETKYSIQYLPEIDVEKLGYLEFLITVKFLDKFPNINTLKDVLGKEPRVQIALLTKGEVDLIIYALSKDSEEMTNTIINIRNSLNYESIWNASPIYVSYSFLPIREQFIDLIKDKLLARDYATLKELCKNGVVNFTEIDQKYNFDKGRSQYAFHKLKETGVIKRITISMQNVPVKYIGTILINIINESKFMKNREKSMLNIIAKSRFQINKYLFAADTFSPDGLILYLPVFNYEDLDTEIEKLATLDLGIKLTSLVITNIILGSFCYRKFDNNYSVQQEILETQYGATKSEKINYDESSKIKKENTFKLDIRGSRT